MGFCFFDENDLDLGLLDGEFDSVRLDLYFFLRSLLCLWFAGSEASELEFEYLGAVP